MPNDNGVTWKKTDIDSLDLKGLNAVVIGGTGGLGRAITQQLASHGAKVTVVGQTFRDEGVSGIDFVKADLSSVKVAKQVGGELPTQSLDLVVLTTGITAAPEREQTSEGVEKDMAASYFSRYSLLKELAPRMLPQSHFFRSHPRVFIMGFPGSGKTGDPDDLNSERLPYKPLETHFNTVAANEALVFGAKARIPHLKFFGLNPGLIKTNIRNNYLGENSWKSSAIEWVISWISASPEDYAKKIVPLLISPDLSNFNGAIFDKNGNAIEKTPVFTDVYVDKFWEASAKLELKALGDSK
ncbi:unnamed protein product [Kuraishia capsulata CBS 1993]|uniref:NAD-dependent epimerase/dehydratase domain-containing protein n=1 Tax=Kuraishia capsulata CBS 1993 TaxID=1382522 RepID=W6MUA2_9ASCO|nr:uncharacterized protein KUCA_T00005023001 [Kuraishia capsulata CBS 1993]CDK29037.1 unnamed protein product [Kuraishia capsulata CBS 1993]